MSAGSIDLSGYKMVIYNCGRTALRMLGGAVNSNKIYIYRGRANPATLKFQVCGSIVKVNHSRCFIKI